MSDTELTTLREEVERLRRVEAAARSALQFHEGWTDLARAERDTAIARADAAEKERDALRGHWGGRAMCEGYRAAATAEARVKELEGALRGLLEMGESTALDWSRVAKAEAHARAILAPAQPTPEVKP